MFTETIKQRKKKWGAQTGSNMRPWETFQGLDCPRIPLPGKDLRKNSNHPLPLHPPPRALRAKSEHPDLDTEDLSVYFSRNRFCEGYREKRVTVAERQVTVSGHTPLHNLHCPRAPHVRANASLSLRSPVRMNYDFLETFHGTSSCGLIHESVTWKGMVSRQKPGSGPSLSL